jgi:FlgN protein
MSPPINELLDVLAALIAEHRKLLAEVERHQTAIKTINVAGMEASGPQQEAIRLRIANLEGRRRAATSALSNGAKPPAPTLTQLAELHPQHRGRLLALRDELRSVIGQIRQRTHVAGRVAGAVLGHLNTVVRLLAGAMQQAGVYTKNGKPQLAPRIGALEAVG